MEIKKIIQRDLRCEVTYVEEVRNFDIIILINTDYVNGDELVAIKAEISK